MVAVVGPCVGGAACLRGGLIWLVWSCAEYHGTRVYRRRWGGGEGKVSMRIGEGAWGAGRRGHPRLGESRWGTGLANDGSRVWDIYGGAGWNAYIGLVGGRVSLWFGWLIYSCLCGVRVVVRVGCWCDVCHGHRGCVVV